MRYRLCESSLGSSLRDGQKPSQLVSMKNQRRQYDSLTQKRGWFFPPPSFPLGVVYFSEQSSDFRKLQPRTRKVTPSPFLSMNACMLSGSVMSNSFKTPWTIARQAPLSMGFSSKNTRMCCHALLQGILPTQGLNPTLLCLLHL